MTRERTADELTSKELCHGVCHNCHKRTFLWLPGRLCTKCVKFVEQKLNEAMATYLEELEKSDAVD